MPAGPGDVEAEARVRGEALGVHAVEDWDPGVDVVVELDVVFSLVGAQESPDVLHDPALERQGESEKQGVEFGPVEALAQVGTRGDKHDSGVWLASGDGFADGSPGLLPEPAPEHERRVPERGKAIDDDLDVIGSLREDQTSSAARHGVVDVNADLTGPLHIGHERSKHRLDVCRLALAHLGAGLVDYQLAPDQLGAGDSARLDLWRVGPQWNPMIASSLSRRYGVAVRPRHRRVRAR